MTTPLEHATIVLPKPGTTFVGRQAEIDEVVAELCRPECRLVSIVGQGGLGKTRLSIEAARQFGEVTGAEVRFATLDAIHGEGQLFVGLADALGQTLTGPAHPAEQIAGLMAEREILVVMDNFEHLVDDAAGLSTILGRCPGARFLVTSRTVLNLREEWVYALDGLGLGESGEALALFKDRTRQVGPHVIDEVVDEVAQRICALCGGMPLAIELAAAWLRSLSAEEIAGEIERGIEVLSTEMQNVPDRHRSMQAVFDQSYGQLSERDREVFDKLAIFEGGWSRDAARELAGASLGTLSALVGHSMIRRTREGRYAMHELLRQYAREHLKEAGCLEEELDAHANYFAQFAQERQRDWNTAREVEATWEIEGELGNIRLSWRRAVSEHKFEWLGMMLQPVFALGTYRARYREVAELMGAAIESFRDCPEEVPPRVEAEALTFRAWLLLRFGQFEEAQELFGRAKAIYEGGEPIPEGLGSDPDIGLGNTALAMGDFETARAHGELASERARLANDAQNLVVSGYVTANAAANQGDEERARGAREAAMAAIGAPEVNWFGAYILNDQGLTALGEGDVAGAKRRFEQAYRIRQAFQDPEGMALSLAHLGEVAIVEGDFAEAGRLYREAYTHYRDLGDAGGIATVIAGMGRAALSRGELDVARERLGEALAKASSINYTPMILEVLGLIGALHARMGDGAAAAEILMFVGDHPGAQQKTRAEAIAELEAVAKTIPAAAMSRAHRRAAQHELAALAAAVATVVADPMEAPATGAGHAEPEQLSEREVEILRMVAKGATNAAIADRLGIGVGTVKWHNAQIFSKLGVSNRTEAGVRARKMGITS